MDIYIKLNYVNSVTYKANLSIFVLCITKIALGTG